MKKILFPLGVIAILAAANANAAATGSTVSGVSQGSALSSSVHFDGEIVAGTCVVKTSSPTQTVALDTVNNQLFGGNGTTTGNKNFSLSFTGCTTNTTTHAYAVHFDGQSPAGKSNVLQAERTGGTVATDVGIQVTSVDSNQTITFTQGSGTGDIPLTPNTSGDATLNMIAKYQQLGSVIPAAGKITADMTYTVVYK